MVKAPVVTTEVYDAMDAIGLDADDDAVEAAGLFAGALRSPRLIAPH